MADSCRGHREKKSVKESAERDERKNNSFTKKTQKRKKWQKRKKREKDGERADGEKISSSVFFFRARKLFFLSSLISALSDSALLKKEQTL